MQVRTYFLVSVASACVSAASVPVFSYFIHRGFQRYTSMAHDHRDDYRERDENIDVDGDDERQGADRPSLAEVVVEDLVVPPFQLLPVTVDTALGNESFEVK